jgi:hypothetical protein
MVCPTGSCESCEHGVEVLLEARESRIEQLCAWDHHEIDSAKQRRRHVPENLSNQPFSPIPPDRIPQLFRRDDPQASSIGGPLDFARRGPLDHQHREKAPPAPLGAIEDLLELPSLPEAPALVEPGLS